MGYIIGLIVIFIMFSFEDIVEGVIKIKNSGKEKNPEIKEDVISLIDKISMIDVVPGTNSEINKKEAVEQLQELLKKL